MKKITALILSFVFILSLAACGNTDSAKKEKTKAESWNDTAMTNSNTASTEENNISDIADTNDFSNVSSFDEFVDAFDKDFYVEITENEDGSVVIDAQKPTVDQDETDKTKVPAIPTFDKVKPTEPTTPAKPAEPEKKADDNTVPSPKPTPEPQPEPQPEPTPETAPETTPEPEPTPEPEKPAQKEETKTFYTYTTNQKHQKLNYTERYLYTILSKEQQTWYRAIAEAVNNLEDSASFNIQIGDNRNYYIYFLYMADNPEHFYLGNTMTIMSNGDGTSKIEFCYSDGVNYCAYGRENRYLTDELRANILAQKATFDAEVERIISTIPSDAPDIEKERLIYDRILMDSYYNLGAKWNGVCESNWNAYGILVNKYGVCESYSEAFQTLCNAVGINCMGVVGTAGGGHKWNAVELDGEWYMCDITFDDPIGGEQGAAYHYYFNRTSKEMTEMHHDWSNCDWPVPECNGTKYSFANYFGGSYWG